MPQISKEQIEQLLKTDRLFKGETDMLQGLLAQPEQTPVRYEYQARSGLWFPFTDQRHHDNTVNDGTYPIRPLYTHPAPFTQPADDGSDWFYRLKFICRVLEGKPPDQDKATAIGMARSLFALKHNEAPFAPITANDVTDEMLQVFLDALDRPTNYRTILAAAVNAWGAKQ
jgi:hypothetical protein